jgi:hypothetical protein
LESAQLGSVANSAKASEDGVTSGGIYAAVPDELTLAICCNDSARRVLPFGWLFSQNENLAALPSSDE